MNDGNLSGSSFYTLSSNQADGATESNSNFAHNTSSSLLFLPPATHNTYGSEHHLKNLSTFVETLEKTAKRAFPNADRSQSRYTSVQVLLLRWAQDDLNVEPEVADLSRAFESYGFHTTKWLIPTQNAHRKLMLEVGEFVEIHDHRDCLMIVYYGGHAFINEARQSMWSCTRIRSQSTLDWSAVQTLFESASSDVLLLLDCCAAASSAPKASKTMTETIAACGWESIAAEPGRFSFTSALIEVLEEWVNRIFSVAMLHSKILDVLKHPRPERLGGTGRIECRRTPVYIVTTENPGMPSIVLTRMPTTSHRTEQASLHKRAREDDHGINTDSNETVKRSKRRRSRRQKDQLRLHDDEEDDFPNATITVHNLDASDQISNTEQLPSPPEEYMENSETLLGNDSSGLLKIPHILISVALEENQMLNLEACSSWLASVPLLARYVKVRSIYRSYSTLMLLSMPVFIWNLLPDDHAYKFIGYVRSGDILSEQVTPGIEGSCDQPLTNRLEQGLLEARPTSDAPISFQGQTNWSRMTSRSPSIARSLSIRTSVPPETGKPSLLLDPGSFTGFGIADVVNNNRGLDWQQQGSTMSASGPAAKKSRTNTPWTPAEEQRLKTMRDAGNSWADIAKTFPLRTEGSVKKHWYKDMHYAEFAEDESQALLNAIKDYDRNKWKEIGKKAGKPAKACEQYAKEHFRDRIY